MKLLVVDDEKLIREVIREYGEAEGYEIVEAENGVEALKILDQENIDLMIDDNYLICKNLSDNFVNTLYLRDVKKQKLEENKYLKEVNSWGEIYRYVYNTEKNKNNQGLKK